MERWNVYEKIKTYIRRIYRFSVGDHECTVFFYDKTERKYALHFGLIVDFRRVIDKAFSGRTASWAEAGPEQKNSVYIAEDSDYKKYFADQCCGIYPFVDDIRHFVLIDAMNTGIEVLADGDPVLSEIGD
jgi:hypothetical protein